MTPAGIFDEVQILNQLKNGDTDAYLTIYNRYHNQLYSHVLRYIKIPELAEDIVQDVFLKLWDIRGQIKPELSVKGYLYRIGRNDVFKMMKRIAADAELRNRIAENIEEISLKQAPEIQWREYSLLLENAINQLPPQRRRVFKLCRQEGKTYEETAVLLGISKYTVKEHMMLAMKSLKQYFHNEADMVLSFLMAGLSALFV